MIAKDATKDIKIEAGEEAGTQKVTFKAANDKITKDLAVKAIGDKKDTFVVKKVQKKTEEKEKAS